MVSTNGQVVVATDSLNNALSRLDDANKNYAAGTSPRFDVISAQRDVANAQQDLINAGVDPCGTFPAKCVLQRISHIQYFFSIGQTF